MRGRGGGAWAAVTMHRAGGHDSSGAEGGCRCGGSDDDAESGLGWQRWCRGWGVVATTMMMQKVGGDDGGSAQRAGARVRQAGATAAVEKSLSLRMHFGMERISTQTTHVTTLPFK